MDSEKFRKGYKRFKKKVDEGIIKKDSFKNHPL